MIYSAGIYNSSPLYGINLKSHPFSAPDFIVYLLIEAVVTCCPVGHSLLFLLHGDDIFHQSYFLVEITYVILSPIYQLVQCTQLGSRKLSRQQVKQGRRIDFNVLAYVYHGLFDNQIMIERQSLYSVPPIDHLSYGKCFLLLPF